MKITSKEIFANKILSEQEADTFRLIRLLIDRDVPLDQWEGIIMGAREAGTLGTPDLPDCVGLIEHGRKPGREK